MLSTVLRHRVWPLAQTKLLRVPRTLQICRVVRPHSVLSVRCFSSTLSGSGGDLNGLDQLPDDEAAGNVHWRSRAWEKKVVLVLQTYKEVHGDTIVPRPFVVPEGDARWPRDAWGYRLGKAVNKLRVKLKDGDLPADFVDKLASLEFVPSVFQFRWEEVIMPALRHFHELHGHPDVPRDFEVPTGDDSWPELLRGWKLGASVRDIRAGTAYAAQLAESRAELERMDFCFTSIVERDWTQKIIPSLKVFRKLYGHCIVENRFKVPAMPPWPKKAWGEPLGVTVKGMRTGKTYTEQVARDRSILEELDFVWNHNLWIWNTRIIPALKVYFSKHGHCRMRTTFVVPKQAAWPKSMWGMALGHKLYDMKCQGSYFAIIGRDVDRLRSLGFSFELRGHGWQRWVVPLLDMYEAIFGDKQIPQNFVVPSEAPWPKDMWGVALGYIVARNAHHSVSD